MFLLEDGLVKLTRLSPAGREAVFWLRRPGELLGAPPALLGLPHAFSASTVTECRAHKLPLEALLRAVATNGDAAKLVIRTLSEDLLAVSRILLDYRSSTAAERLDRLMAWLEPFIASSHAGSSPAHTGLTDMDLASLVGVSAEHFSRVKKSRPKEVSFPGPEFREQI